MDRLIHTPTWHWRGEYVRVKLPDAQRDDFLWCSVSYAIVETGPVAVITRQAHTEDAESIICDLSAPLNEAAAKSVARQGLVSLRGTDARDTSHHGCRRRTEHTEYGG